MQLRDEGGSLSFEVRDDGADLDPETAPPGAGVVNMNDRLEAVGGRCTVESAPGAGTSVRGVVPVPAMA